MNNQNGELAPPSTPSGTYLFVVPWDLEHPGGVNEVVINLYRQFVRRNLYRPMVLIPSWEHRTERYQRKSGFEILHLRLQEFPQILFTRPKEIITFALRWPITLWRLYSLLRRHEISVVNPHYPGLNLIHFAALKILFPAKFKLVISFHGSDVMTMENSTYYTLIMKWILLRADTITVPSNALMDRLVAIVPKIKCKILGIYNGVDQEKFRSEHSSSSLLPQQLQDKPYILHVGSFERVKGQDVLLQAFKLLNDCCPEMHLLLVGRSGSLLNEIEKGIEILGLSGHVFILTNVKHDDIPALMKGASIIVLPSRSEGFPLVLLEAAMSNCAVIASRVGGVPELIKDGENGLLVEPENHAQLASAMAQLVTDSKLRNLLAEKLSDVVSEGFSWERTAKGYSKAALMFDKHHCLRKIFDR